MPATSPRTVHRRWIVSLVLVVTVLLVNVLRFSDVRAPSTHATVSGINPTKCVTMNAFHRDPLFIAHALCLSQSQTIGVIRELVFTITRLFETHNITHFLDSGTLLGAYRNQSIIPYDTDADLAIDPTGFDYIRTRRLEVPDSYFLAVYASGDWFPGSERDKAIPIRLIHQSTALYVDVFVFEPYEPEDGETMEQEMIGPYPSWAFDRCVQCQEYYNQGKRLLVPRAWIYPTVPCRFEGKSMHCPHETVKYLTYMFGDDFDIPIQY